MKVKLSDICDYVKGKTSVSELDERTYISTENMLPNKMGISLASSLPSTEQTQVYYKNDVLISNIRPYFKKIWKAEWNGGCSADVLVFRAKTGVYQDFLYFVLSDDKFFEYSMATSKGTKMPRGDKTSIMQYEVELPTYEEQVKIASILSDFEEKIKLNNKINNNLLEQLFSLYNNLMSTSQDVQEVTLSSLCHFQEGYVNPSQSHPEYFDGDVKWLRAVDINESFIIDTSRTLTQVGFESAKKSALLFKPNTIAISKSGTIGRLGIVADYMCGNRAVINISPNTSEHLAFIYCFLKSKQQEFPDMAVGSVQRNLYVSLLEPLIVLIPSEKKLSDFNSTGTALLNTIQNNCVENIKLSSIRDSLLPKLMSGEIDVSTVNV